MAGTRKHPAQVTTITKLAVTSLGITGFISVCITLWQNRVFDFDGDITDFTAGVILVFLGTLALMCAIGGLIDLISEAAAYYKSLPTIYVQHGQHIQ